MPDQADIDKAIVLLARVFKGRDQAKWLEQSFKANADKAFDYWLRHPRYPEFVHLYEDITEIRRVKVEAATATVDAVKKLMDFDFVQQSLMKAVNLGAYIGRIEVSALKLKSATDHYLKMRDYKALRQPDIPAVDKMIADADKEYASLLETIGQHESTVTSVVGECANRIEQWPVRAYVDLNKSKGREYFHKGCECFNFLTNILGYVTSADPKLAPLVAAIQAVRNRIEGVVDSVIKESDVKDFNKGNEVGAGYREANKDETIMARSLYQNHLDNLKGVLDFAGIGMQTIPVVGPFWGVAREFIEATVNEVFKTKIKLLKAAQGQPDEAREEQVREWMKERKDILIDGAAERLAGGDPVEIVKKMIGKFCARLVALIIHYVPMDAAQAVSGDDLLTARNDLREAAVTTSERGGFVGVAPVAPGRLPTNRPAARDAAAPTTDRRGRDIQATNGKLGTGEWKVKINDIWGILDRENRFDPFSPLAEDFGVDQSAFDDDPWTQRYLNEAGYRQGGDRGAQVEGRWYQPWPNRDHFVFVRSWPGEVEWVHGATKTVLGGNYTVKFALEGGDGKYKKLLRPSAEIVNLIRGGGNN
jgi:hypothetical protein